MLNSTEAIYRDGKLEWLEKPPDVKEARVIVTFLPGGRTPPAFTPEELAELRGKFAAWEEDWNAPGMEAYDVDAAMRHTEKIMAEGRWPTRAAENR